MGGEGHIADMAQRNKQNRELLQQRRELTRRLAKKINEKSHSSCATYFSEGKLEIDKIVYAKKMQADKRFYLLFTFLFIGIVALLTILVYWIFF